MMMFCTYDTRAIDYLRMIGNDMSRIDDMILNGYNPVFICSHHRSNGGWRKGISATANALPGEYLDEHAHMVNINEFLEWHGGERYRTSSENENLDIHGIANVENKK